MGLFDHFPYSNMHELNLNWLLKAMRELETIVETFVHAESLKFSDPIEWNITTQYAKNTIVLDENGNAFLSKQPVPTGIQLNNEDYWLKIFDFINYQEVFDKNLTFNVELNTTQASAAYSVDDWLLWNNVLYKVTQAIAINDDFIIGTNITHFTVEDFIKAFMNWATATIQQYKNDIDASELAYRTQLAQDIANTTASLQSQLNIAIAGVTVDSEVINARVGVGGVTYSTLGDAIRTQIANIINPFNAFTPLVFEGLTYSKGSVSNPQTVNYTAPQYCARELTSFNAASSGSDADGFLSYKILDNVTIPILTSGDAPYEITLFIKSNKPISKAIFRLSTYYTWGSAFSSCTDVYPKTIKAGSNLIKCTFSNIITGSDGVSKYKYLAIEFDNRYNDLDFEVYAFVGTALYDQLNRLDTLITKEVDYTTKYLKGSYINLNLNVGDTVDVANKVSNTQFANIVLKCKAGDKFVVSGFGGTAPRVWAFTDNNYVLKSVAATSIVNDLEVEAAEDGYFISDLDFQQVPHKLIYKYAESEPDNVNRYDADIIFWGDSLTVGAGGGGTNFPAVCASILNASYLNCGVGGETANMIAARQGGNSLHLPIGSNITQMAYTDMIDDFGMYLTPMLQGTGSDTGSNLIINDDVYSIKNNQSVISPTLKYDIDGYTALTSVYPITAKFRGSLFRSKIDVIFVGTNGAYVNGVSSFNNRLTIIDSMIAHCANDYLIMGLSVGDSSRDSEDATLLAKYGDKYFNTRKLLVEYGLSIAGITPTTQDNTDISNGVVPTSLRADSTHLNASGYTALGTLLANKIKSMNIL